ncbi:UNVERIFIED_CONTAM: hypothetical protein Sangu_3014800 [Sesamum angustifolium]|uniref:Uncharacterized protein n=1 Tax=Sesamum angustifolium TaxID=2727405 RepID=A0AAW2KP15_9LAMI
MTWACFSEEDLDRILEAVEAEVKGDTDQVLEATIGEGASERILPMPMVEDVPSPSNEAEVKDIPTPQGEVVDDTQEKAPLALWP